MNLFNDLPLGIIENMLSFLPIQDAARTSILSKEWRYRWIKNPKVTFIEDTFQVSNDRAVLPVLEQKFYTHHERKMMFKRPKFLYAINQVLSMHKGPIHEFTLSMEISDCYDEFEHIVSHLAHRKTVKKLKLYFDLVVYSLPLSLFSFCQLTDLCLARCFVSPPPTFKGFRSLTSLSLQNIWIYRKPLHHLLSSCPLLKTLTLVDSVVNSIGERYNIINLFECLPVTETLTISLEIIEAFKFSMYDEVPRKFPTALIHLKCLSINGVTFTHKDGLSILVLLINSSPNLEKLKIGNTELEKDISCMEYVLFKKDDSRSFTLEDYEDIWLEHLNVLHISHFKNWGNELNIVKLILAKSPVLKKVIYNKVSYEEGLQISQVFLSCPRASPVVEIIF